MPQSFTLLSSPNAGQESLAGVTPLMSPANQVSTIIDQVRELLHGEALRDHGRRAEDVEQAVRTLDQRAQRRFDEMQSSIEALGHSLRQEQAEAIRAIGLSIMDIGRQIAAMGEVSDRGTDRKPR